MNKLIEHIRLSKETKARLVNLQLNGYSRWTFDGIVSELLDKCEKEMLS